MGKDLKGKKLGKGITQRPDGRYMARFVDRYGKRHTYYDFDLKSLKRVYEKEKYEAEHGLLGQGSDIKLNEWFDEFIKVYKEDKIKVTTIHRLHQTYNYIRNDAISKMRLKDIRAVHVQKVINNMQAKEYAYGTIKLVRSLLNDMFKRAVGNGYMVINPCQGVVMPPEDECEARFLTEEEQEMFFSVSKGYYHNEIFQLAISIGGRIGEVLGMGWDSVDFDNHTLSINRTLHYGNESEGDVCHFFFTLPKTRASKRTIPMSQETEEILQKVKRIQLMNKSIYKKQWSQKEGFEDLVFTSKQGSPIRYGDVTRTMRNVIARVNIQEQELAKIEGREPRVLEHFTPHSFRHTFVTMAIKNGVPKSIVSQYIGHETEDITDVYDHTENKTDFSELLKVKIAKIV